MRVDSIIYRVVLLALITALVIGCGTSRKGGQKSKPKDKQEATAADTSFISTPKPAEALPETAQPSEPLVEAIPEAAQPSEPLVEAIPEAEQSSEPLVEAIPEAEQSSEPPIETAPEATDPPPTPPTAPTLEKEELPMDVEKEAEEADSVKKPAIDVAPSVRAKPIEMMEDEPKQPKPKSKPEGPRIVNFEADLMRPIKIEGDSTALSLVGNVVLYHNGAVITCDSALRYSDKRMECFKRVIINKGTTYIYGDRADYNGELNEAHVYAPIVKVVDKDATLYTYNFSFNTQDNIGIYSGGGTMTQKDNQMESKRGYYYVDEREMVGVDEVELRNDEYSMKSDSAVYNMDTEIARFFTTTHVWNSKKEILIADKGRYNHVTADYNFTENSYVLTKDQEVWSDTLNYNSRSENATLYGNIQLREEEQKVIGFGDYGEYWGEQQEGMLTLDPSLLSFDPQEPDTLYMRSDSMFFYTFDRDTVLLQSKETVGAAGFSGEQAIGPTAASIAEKLQKHTQTLTPDGASESDSTRVEVGEPGGITIVEDSDEGARYAEGGDSILREVADTTDVGELYDQKAHAKALKEAQAKAKSDEKLRKAEQKKRERQERDAAKELLKRGKKESYDEDDDHEGHSHGDTSMEGVETLVEGDLAVDSLAVGAGVALDSAGVATIGYTPANGVGADSLAVVPQEKDSLQRMIRAYRNVRIYRTDFQAVCDSLVGFSIDSTLRLYIEPVLWAENNQIKSDVMDIFTRNKEIYKGEFSGSPIMIAEVDSLRYNQVKGKFMEAWFRNNDIYKNDVIGNGQTLYYMQEDDTGDLMGFLVAECADITFLIEERKMNRIIYKGSPVYSIFPMDKIPEEQETFLPGFKWEAERRPMSKEDVFTRTIHNSQREQIEQLPEPTFPLTESIMRDKERMILGGIWRERNDVLSPQALEFIRSLTIK